MKEEEVMEIMRVEKKKGKMKGVIVKFGGKKKIKIENEMEKEGIKIIGKQKEEIEIEEDRDRLKKIIIKIEIKKKKKGIEYQVEKERMVEEEIGLKMVVRKYYVMGGREMKIINEERGLKEYMIEKVKEMVKEEIKEKYKKEKKGKIKKIIGKKKIMLEKYMKEEIEVEVD